MTRERQFADTNLLLRYLTDDIPAQADAGEALLKRAEQGESLLVTKSAGHGRGRVDVGELL
ncbi:MAG: hypothetical protein AB1671_03970 [Thermodesulfobacteriota bacterium]